MAEIRDALWRQLDATIYIVHSSDDPMAGRVELVSSGTFRLLGYQADEFVQDPGLWHRIMHPDDVAGVIQQTQEIFRLREPRTRIYRLRHAVTGEYRWIEDSAVPLNDEQGNLIGIAGVARDITVLKQAEHELRRRHHQLEVLIDAVPDGVLVADNRGLILQTNEGVERILGWKSQELVGKPVEALLPEHFRGGHARLRTGYAAAPQIRRMGVYQLVGLHKNGNEIPVDIMLGPVPNGEENHVLVVIRDMTEQRISQQRLAYLSAIVESADDSIVGSDPEGVIVSWNRGAERLFGYTEPDVLGKHVMLTFPEDIRSECLNNLASIGQGARRLRYESRRKRRDGSEFDVSVIVSPVVDSQGKLLGISSICRDITERKRADAALQVAKQAAEIGSQTKSEFLANMSHELRTPLNGVIGLTDVVLDSELTEEQREYLNIVKDSAHTLLTTLSEILEISKLQSGKRLLEPKQFWLRDLVDTTMKEVEASAHQKNLHLTWQLQPNVPLVLLGDSVCLRQILSNLVRNAIKFTATGDVSVTVEAASQDPGVLSFSVRDTGIGVPADQQQIIFEPFSQVDSSVRRQFGGSGLGLAICAQLIEIMGGRIWVDSDGHTGSTFHFTVRLEVVHTAAEKAAPEPGVHPTPAERRRETRRAIEDPAQMRILRPLTPIPLEVQILDVSKSGLKVRAGQSIDQGALVQITFEDSSLIAEVRYCLAAGTRFHIGLQLVSA